jgi:hypothetical protein
MKTLTYGLDKPCLNGQPVQQRLHRLRRPLSCTSSPWATFKPRDLASMSSLLTVVLVRGDLEFLESDAKDVPPFSPKRSTQPHCLPPVLPGTALSPNLPIRRTTTISSLSPPPYETGHSSHGEEIYCQQRCDNLQEGCYRLEHPLPILTRKMARSLSSIVLPPIPSISRPPHLAPPNSASFSPPSLLPVARRSRSLCSSTRLYL